LLNLDLPSQGHLGIIVSKTEPKKGEGRSLFAAPDPCCLQSVYIDPCWRLAGGTIPFMRRYSTICP
jgi:hypothetical protein